MTTMKMRPADIKKACTPKGGARALTKGLILACRLMISFGSDRERAGARLPHRRDGRLPHP